MASFDPITKELISIGSVETGQMADIAGNVTSMSVSLTMDQASELSFSVVDPDFLFASNNYFQIRRDVFYRELIFEIARVEVSRSQAIHPEYRLVCYNKNVQMMKRDKKPEAYRGISASDYARTVAKRFNMNVFVENTPKKQSIVKGRSNNADENVWTVLQRSASEAEFVCFEIDNCLFFCSQKFLLGKWGDPNYQYMGNFFVPFGWPENDEKAFPGSRAKYVLMDMPTFSRSENDPMDAEGTLSVERTNGVQLRPGMTVNITGIPDFENGYLITDVSFEEGSPNPVRVSFRTPVKPAKGQKGKTGSNQTGTVPTDSAVETERQRRSQLDVTIISAIQDFVKSNFSGGGTETQRAAAIKEQTDAAIAAASQAFAGSTEVTRRQLIQQQYLLLGGSDYQVALAALRSVEAQILAGPSPVRNTSGFPTDGIISAQANLAAGLISSDVAVGLGSRGATETAATSGSVMFRSIVPDVAGSLPRSVEEKVRVFVESRTTSSQYSRAEKERLIKLVIEGARVVYNLVTLDSKRLSFDAFLRRTRDQPVARQAMQSIRADLIKEPPASFANAGNFDLMVNSRIGR
jgi:hypothetical protein